MHRPESPEHGTTFELARIAAELRADAAYIREGHAARTLTRADDLRVILVVLRAGNSISEHQASTTASIQVLAGQLRTRLPDRTVQLAAGELLVLGADLPHDVQAESESAFLLTLGWPGRR